MGQRSSAARNDDALYAMVGRAGQTDTPAPPAVPANTPAPPDPDGDAEGGMPESEAQVMSPPHPPETAEYACVRKLRKAPQKRDSGTDMGEPPAPPPRHAPPSHPAPPPPHPHSTKLPRRNVDAFNVPAFPRVRKNTLIYRLSDIFKNHKQNKTGKKPKYIIGRFEKRTEMLPKDKKTHGCLERFWA